MTTLHMQTEIVHSTARQMVLTASQADAQLQSLLRALQALEAAWQGGSSEKFFAEAQEILRRLQTQRELLDVLAERAEREVSEWEDVDQRGAASMRMDLSGGNALLGESFTLPAITIAGLTLSLPVWLSDWLRKLFPPSDVISPLADAQPDNHSEQKTKLGELLEKAEKEEQERAQQQPAQQPPVEKAPLPDHMVDYPARPNDGTYIVGQEEDDSCAIASTKMALDRVGINASESDLREASTKIEGGYHNAGTWGSNPSSLDNLVNTKYADAASASYNNPGTQTISNLDTAAENGNGVVVTVRNSEWFGEANAHSVTVVDIVTENGEQVVLVNDPWPPGEGKRIAVPASEFESAWYGDAMYITKKTQE